MINIQNLSKKYQVRFMQKEDASMLLEFNLQHPYYYEVCPPSPSITSIESDLNALPPNKTFNDKYYLGFFKGKKLMALIDIIHDYPTKGIAFIGFFMVSKIENGKGIGSALISEIVLE